MRTCSDCHIDIDSVTLTEHVEIHKKLFGRAELVEEVAEVMENWL